MANRISTLDILKGIAIILVITAHCIQFGSGKHYLESEYYFDNPVFKLIYSFHMPLFMLISGYLFQFSIKAHGFKHIIRSRFTGLLIPVLVWQTLWIIFFDHSILTGHNPLYVFNSYLNTLWFITSVFINSLIVLFCNRYAKDSIYVYSSIIIISLFIPNYHGYNLFVFMFPYFLCGYLYNKTGGMKKTLSRNEIIIFTIILLIGFILLFSEYNKNDYAYTSGTFLIKDHTFSLSQLYTDIYRWVIGGIGSSIIIFFVHLSFNTCSQLSIITLLRKIGTKTMGLYIISTYLFKFFILLPISTPSFLVISAESAIITLVSYIFTLTIEQNYYSRKILLGGR